MIGLLAAFVLHGTSSLLFVLLRLHPSQQPPPPPAIKAQAPAGSRAPESSSAAGRVAGADEDDDDDDDDDFGFEGGGSSARETTTTATSGSPVAPRNRRGRDASAALGGLYENHWRALSDHRKAPVKSRHRGKLKGLLAQTIHEESSESESL